MCNKKKCRNCGELKLISDYHKHNNSYRLDCKICFRAKERERRVKRLLKKDPEHANRVLKIQEERKNRGVKPDGKSWCYVCKKYLTNNSFSPHNLKNSGMCTSCSSENDTQRNRVLKLKSIEYKGGKCVRCGFIGHYSSFEFHHITPYDKEFSWGVARKKSFNKIKLELDKCDLLCSNCHNLVHTKLNNDGSINEEYVSVNK